MNAIDLLPVDLLPWIARGVRHRVPAAAADRRPQRHARHGVRRAAPGALYSIKIKGLGGWLHELFSAPFGQVKLTSNPLTWIGALLLAIANFGLNLIEYLAKTLSLGMRLFGNMYAGELMFFLIALLGGTATAWGLRCT